MKALQTDASFVQFETMAYGWRAAFVLLTRTYYHTYRLFTIRAIISRWAPPNENNTKRYIENVSRLTGIGPDEPLGIPSEKPARWMKLGAAEIDETDNATLTVKFPPAARAGDVVYKGTGLTVGYPGKVVFRDADIEIKRGEKVAFVGRNGEGKTTMMRVIVGELSPIEGESCIGHNVSCGYFAQNQEDILDKSDTVLGTLDRIAVGDIRARLRDLLAQFLFRGEDIDKRVSVLSGGERARLGMARLMLQNHNLLALDEPTNHMDIKSKDILKQALKAYDGTLVIVSHDRDFLEGLVDKLYEFRDGHVREFLGSVGEFLAKRRLESLQELERWGNLSSMDSAPTPPRNNYQEMRAKSKEEKKRRNRVDFLEREIEKLEAAMKKIEAVLEAPGPEDDIMELTREYLECKRDLDAKTEEWGELLE